MIWFVNNFTKKFLTRFLASSTEFVNISKDQAVVVVCVGINKRHNSLLNAFNSNGEVVW